MDILLQAPNIHQPIANILIFIPSQWFSRLAHLICFGTNYFQADSLQAILKYAFFLVTFLPYNFHYLHQHFKTLFHGSILQL